MKKLFYTVLAMLLITACAGKKSDAQMGNIEGLEDIQEDNKGKIAYKEFVNAPGDSTVYGLACEGCDDSVVVFLPYSGGDPITYSIIEARKKHRIFGKPQTGSNIALILNKEDSSKCDVVIVIDELLGNWCYLVKPEVRKPEGPAGMKAPALPDSLRELMNTPREYGLSIVGGGLANVTGVRHAEDEEDGPIQYPKPERYNAWRLWNGLLLLTRNEALPVDSTVTMADSVNAPKSKEVDDTFRLTMMMPDSLIITNMSDSKPWNFYRKKEVKEEKGKDGKSKKTENGAKKADNDSKNQ